MSRKSSFWHTTLSPYLLEHVRVALNSVGDVLKNPVASLLTILTIAVVLLQPTLLHIGLKTAQSASNNLANNYNLALFLEPELPESAALDLRLTLQRRTGIKNVDYISPKQGLKEFAERTGLSAVIEKLPNNPLPATLVITPNTPISQPQLLDLRKQMLAIEGVDSVRLDIEWAERFAKMVLIANRIGLIVNILLALAVLFVIGNTIRLAIENKKSEIEISRLMGATDPFIRRPFLYMGFLYGFLGATFSWVALSLIVAWLVPPLRYLSKIYNFQPPTGLIPMEIVFLLLATGTAVGFVGAWAAFSSHLSAIDRV
ncbi:MAG TPA: hypothetical protein DCZ03_02035 [Gammaproteobacteria bacterium]|nr:hypothetical protein [Gammaproteobacteria bacterium]